MLRTEVNHVVKGIVSNPISQFVLGIIGILIIGPLPYLIFDIDHLLEIQVLLDSGRLRNTLFLYQPIELQPGKYVTTVLGFGKELLHVLDWTYINERGGEKPLFPIYQDVYVKTLKYLFLTFSISFTVSILFTYFIMMMNERFKKGVKFFFFVIESLPDLFVIIGLQLFVMWFFKKTNILLFNPVSTFGDEAFLLPLLVLSFLPTIYMTRYLLLTFEEEYQSLYVELARGKGLTKTGILFRHIFRNAFASFVYHFKTIFWFTLSNLLIIEIALNVNGLLRFVWVNCARNPELLTLGLLSIFVPFFIVLTLLRVLVTKYSLKGVAE